MKSTNVAMYHETPRGRCVWCLKPAWSGTDTCRSCRGVASYQQLPVDETHALTGGRWVAHRGGVQRWEPVA